MMISNMARLVDWLEWLVALRNPVDIIADHWSYFALEILLYVCGLLTLVHAVRLGGRYLFLWLATLFHGITVEMISYFLPDIDNFWHAQSTIMLIGKRLPLHIVLLYPVFLYTASVSVYRLRLPPWSEPWAVGLATVLLDVPFDILGVKNIFWSWHDTDPNLADRSYHVPMLSYMFHANFAAVLTILLKGFRKVLTGTTAVETYRESDRGKELLCSIFTGLLVMPLGVLLFIPLYHIPHDLFLISTELCVSLHLIGCLVVCWMADRNPSIGARTGKIVLDEILLVVVSLYVTYFGLAYLSRPQAIVSEGLHERVGSCEDMTEVYTPLGMVLKKRSNLCLTDYHEPYFDFQCTSRLPLQGAEWYTICGTAHKNFAEFVLVVGAACVVGLTVFFNLLIKSGNDLVQSPFKVKRY